MDWIKKLIKGKTVCVGIGNPLREDDYVGCYITELLKEKKTVFTVEVNPEIFIDEIAGENPDTIIIFDAADFEGKPGDVRIINEKEIDNMTISTHTIPISFFVHMLKRVSKARVFIVGIKPLSTGYREGLTEIIRNVADSIVKTITS